MSTAGQFSSKNPTIKRILKEASELANNPSPDYHAAPLETDLFEWHFTLRGAPSPSPFEGGVYHGRIILPPAYPLRPPSFRFLTPTGRFEVNREICLSISGHHEETWQPAWGIRTALVAIRSFMDTDAKGQLGGMDSTEEVRKRLASQSKIWRCAVCGKSNTTIMQEQDDAVKEHGGQSKKEEVPDELRLAYREDLSKTDSTGAMEGKVDAGETTTKPLCEEVVNGHPSPPPVMPASDAMADTTPQQQVQRETPIARVDDAVPAWIDKAIYGVLAAILFLLWKKIGD